MANASPIKNRPLDGGETTEKTDGGIDLKEMDDTIKTLVADIQKLKGTLSVVSNNISDICTIVHELRKKLTSKRMSQRKEISGNGGSSRINSGFSSVVSSGTPADDSDDDWDLSTPKNKRGETDNFFVDKKEIMKRRFQSGFFRLTRSKSSELRRSYYEQHDKIRVSDPTPFGKQVKNIKNIKSQESTPSSNTRRL